MVSPGERTPAYWSSAEQVQNHSWADWLAAHTSFLPPLHHYKGDIAITPQSGLLLEGTHKDTKENFRLLIEKKDLISCKVGFDETFKRRYDRQLGFEYQPLALTFKQNDKTETIYLSIDISNKLWRSSKNDEWSTYIQGLIES
jgi:hypothetical protein